MIEVLEFIFQDLWHWLGTICLLAVIAECGPLIKINIGTKKRRKRNEVLYNRGTLQIYDCRPLRNQQQMQSRTCS